MSKPRAIMSFAFSNANFLASFNFRSLKFRYCEKATQFDKIFHLFLKILDNVKIKRGDFFKILWPSHNIRPLNKNFSSSVNCMTRGTSKVSCSHLVKINGIKWPICMAVEDGPRPVYKKNGFFFSTSSKTLCMSRWEKNTPEMKIEKETK